MTAEVETVHLQRALQKPALLNENKQRKASQQQRINACEVTTRRFIF